jgi:hypothetical protein
MGVNYERKRLYIRFYKRNVETCNASQAQGNAHVNSDWDILILLNKIKIEHTDFDNVAYPLMELGWNIGAEINPILYTHEDWKKRNFTPFYKNVMQQGIELWH